MSILFLDIESAPLDGITPPEFDAPANLRDPEKIAAAKAKKLEAWKGSLALHAETARVLCVGVMEDGFKGVYEGDETDILLNAWETIDGAETIIGHNLRGFDIPFLARRSWILGVPVPRIMAGRFLDARFVDTMEAWSCGNREERISLDNLAKALGVGAKTGSGADFAALYAKDRKAALGYLENDLRLTKAVAERMGLT